MYRSDKKTRNISRGRRRARRAAAAPGFQRSCERPRCATRAAGAAGMKRRGSSRRAPMKLKFYMLDFRVVIIYILIYFWSK